MQRQGTSQTKSVTVLLSGTVTAKDVLQLDNAASGDARFYTAKIAATSAKGNPLAAGVAATGGVAGDQIPMYVEGIVSTLATGSPNGEPVVVDSVAGTAEIYVVGDHTMAPFGIAMSAVSGGFADVYLLNPLRLGY